MAVGSGVRALSCSATQRIAVFGVLAVLGIAPAFAADTITGRVTGAGAPIAGSTVTLWAASAAAPKQLAQGRTDQDGRFTLSGAGAAGDATLYLLQMQTDLAIGPAGDVWVMNNWQDIDSCFGVPSEVLSTRCGGQGVTIFFGMAKPVRAPQIGPARAP